MSYTYEQLDEFLGGRDKKFIKRSDLKTYVVRDETDLVIYLVDTPIMTYRPDGSIVLYSGGWKTTTTKQRMNDYLPQPWGVYQDKSLWWVGYNNYWGNTPEGKSYPFAENIELYPDGSVIGAGEDPKAEQKLIRQVNQYCKDFIAALDAREVPAPSGGDCWLCSLFDQNGLQISNPDHILSHLEEKYYVPTLLVNACGLRDDDESKWTVSKAAAWYLQGLWNDQGPHTVFANVAKQQLTRALRVYIKRQLGLAY